MSAAPRAETFPTATFTGERAARLGDRAEPPSLLARPDEDNPAAKELDMSNTGERHRPPELAVIAR